MNVALEIYMLYLLFTPEVFEYFTTASAQDGLSIADSPMGGAWLGLVAVGAAMGAFFPTVGALIDGTFKRLGFVNQGA